MGTLDNDVVEVLKVKAYFCNADKSIFKQTGTNCSNCQKNLIYLESNYVSFQFSHIHLLSVS